MQGILMTPDNIKATREKRKWQTRRLDHLKEINQEPDRWIRAEPVPAERLLYTPFKGLWQFTDADNNFKLVKPRYQVGESVYIKETWAVPILFDEMTGKEIEKTIATIGIWYKNDDTQLDNPIAGSKGRRRSPMFMPAWAARDFVKILDIKAQRLQDITEEEAIAEGCKAGITLPGGHYTAVYDFSCLWDSINPKYPFEGNYWVWAYTYELTIKGE